jgi:hypothetical protein
VGCIAQDRMLPSFWFPLSPAPQCRRWVLGAAMPPLPNVVSSRPACPPAEAVTTRIAQQYNTAYFVRYFGFILISEGKQMLPRGPDVAASLAQRVLRSYFSACFFCGRLSRTEAQR